MNCITYIFGIILVIFTSDTSACNGYKAKLLSYDSCGDPGQIVSIDDGFTIKLNKKCELIPTGCVTHKAFQTAKINYKVSKNGVALKEGSLNVCELASKANAEIKKFMKVFGVPENCPVDAGKICTKDQPIDLSKYKNMLSLARGTFQLSATAKHDTGTSCLNMEVEITK